MLRRLLQLHQARPKDVQVCIPRPAFAQGLDFGQSRVIFLVFPQSGNSREFFLEPAKIVHDRRPFPFFCSRSVCSISFFIWRAFWSGGSAAAKSLISL